MNLPRNGTGTANVLLVLTGVVLGAVLTIIVYRPVSSSPSDRPVDSSAGGSSGRHLALPRAEREREPTANSLLNAALAEDDPRRRAQAMREAGAAAARP